MPEQPYTGIGARKTPAAVLRRFTDFAVLMARQGFVLRSGAADGADSAFEQGADAAGGPKEIYLPWPGFNDHPSGRIYIPERAFEIARGVHPHWHNLKPGVRRLHARNALQVLGVGLESPSRVVVCWTPDGCIDEHARSRETGGTGTAIALASRHNIPVLNAQRPAHAALLETCLTNQSLVPLHEWLGGRMSTGTDLLAEQAARGVTDDPFNDPQF